MGRVLLKLKRKTAEPFARRRPDKLRNSPVSRKRKKIDTGEGRTIKPDGSWRKREGQGDGRPQPIVTKTIQAAIVHAADGHEPWPPNEQKARSSTRAA